MSNNPLKSNNRSTIINNKDEVGKDALKKELWDEYEKISDKILAEFMKNCDEALAYYMKKLEEIDEM